jgi:DNA-binding NarL/FixJ family response regulator
MQAALSVIQSFEVKQHPVCFPDCEKPLTSREEEVLQLLSQGLTNAEIGQTLFISGNTVAKHVHSILEKTGCANRTELAATVKSFRSE